MTRTNQNLLFGVHDLHVSNPKTPPHPNPNRVGPPIGPPTPPLRVCVRALRPHTGEAVAVERHHPQAREIPQGRGHLPCVDRRGEERAKKWPRE